VATTTTDDDSAAPREEGQEDEHEWDGNNPSTAALVPACKSYWKQRSSEVELRAYENERVLCSGSCRDKSPSV
jgi:hypothetical protein